MTKIKSLTRKELKEYKENLRLNEIQKEVIIGTLLGDASMSLGNNKPVYAIKFEQSIKNKSYIEHLFQIFEPFCLSLPVIRLINKQEVNNPREAIYFKTIRHSSFIYYFNLFYKVQQQIDPKTGLISLTKKKRVPKNIHQLLTTRALAYWFMDDGTYHNQKGNFEVSKTYLFSTQSFEKHECLTLIKALKRNFDLKGELHKDKNYWRIYILKESCGHLKQIIEPYIHTDFKYKL